MTGSAQRPRPPGRSRVLLAVAILGVLGVLTATPPAVVAQPTASTPPARIEISGPRVLVATPESATIEGISDARRGSLITVTIGDRTETATLDAHGRFALRWPLPLPLGTTWVEASVIDADGRAGRTRKQLLIRAGDGQALRPLVTPPPTFGGAEQAAAEEDFESATDRWRITPPPYELTVTGRRWDPYNQNKWKGDYPIRGDDLFLVLTATSDTLVDGFSVPTPSSVSADRPGSIGFFGQPAQQLVQQNVLFSADLFRGSTAFKPIEWRIKGTVIANGNYLRTAENAAVRPDVRAGVDRARGFPALQELFFEKKLADLSPNYDFVSMRFGVQPFNSDFRGFIFSDTNLGVRLFGSTASNRNQFNLAFFERLEKDTNSGLNRFELRDQEVAVLNFYRQDFLAEGYTAQVSVHWLRDEASLFYDRNGFLARPDPIGSFTPHQVEALYLGWAGFGRLGRFNIDHAVYFVTGDDSLNPIAGPDPITLDEPVDISAWMAAVELSMDRNWYRPRFSYFYASGDDRLEDRDAKGFDAIFDAPNFAGGGFSYWNRLGIRLAGTGVALVSRGSLLPALKTSRDEGQPNFVNPGIHIATAGIDLELTPKIKAILNANYLRFDETAVLEGVLFQSNIDKAIGFDLAVGVRWRPFLNNNFIVIGGAAALLPGDGFRDIYESDSTQYGLFSNVILTF